MNVQLRSVPIQTPMPGGSALQQLLATAEADNPYWLRADRLAQLRLQAAQEVLDLRRGQIQVLERRAADGRIQRIERLADLVPLLFSHTTYKSYPASYVTKGQWSRLLNWFGTLSAVPVNDVDVAGVADIDGFIERLWAAGHLAVTTSGTSGKVSFLQLRKADHDFREGWTARHWFFPQPMRGGNHRHYFQMAPKYGPYLMMVGAPKLISLWARPDSVHYLTEERLRVSFLMRAAEMRQRLAEGSATASAIAEYEAEVKAQQAKAASAFERITDTLLELHREPLVLMAQWAMLWRIMQKARARGIPNGQFHADSIVTGGGGTKGLKLPPDYEQQMQEFLGPEVYMPKRYGMSEMSVTCGRCEAGNYHPVPWVIPMVLDASGERLLDPGTGVVEGRFAFLDLSFHGRWGGLITGDKVRMSDAPYCTCGRAGPVVLPGISRYSDLGEEDKIGCAGTIEAYIRGAIEP